MRRMLNTVPAGFLFVLALAVFLPWTAYAGGNRQITTETADGIDIWQHEFNVSHLKPGTYNIIINAKDSAGNVGVGGPFRQASQFQRFPCRVLRTLL